MKTSVILSTYNQPEWLAKSLTGFACQRVRPWEIVVADDGSGDETECVIREFQAASPLRIRHVWQEDRGFRKTRILNKALLAAEGDYLIFTDGDCVPRSDYVEAHQRLARPGAFLSGGLVRLSLAGSELIDSRLIESGACFGPVWAARRGGIGPHRILKVAAPRSVAALLNRLTHVLPHWSGSNASCWRSDALAVGGFDERMQYWREDFEFGQRLMNLGVRPVQVRYSAVTLHLEHGRGYVDAAVMRKNEEILAHTRLTRKVRTEHGIGAAA